VTVSLLKSSETETPAPAGPHRKPQPDLYTVLLVMALIAVLIGILFLYLQMAVYDFKLRDGPPVGMVQQWSVVSGQWSVASSSIINHLSSFSSSPIPRP
jgi:hypothetical protein